MKGRRSVLEKFHRRFRRNNQPHTRYTGWAKSRYTVIILFFRGIVNDGRERKYRTKKVDCEAVLENL